MTCAPMSDDDRFYFLAGEVSALHAVLFALVHTHPDLPRLGREVEMLEQFQLALTTPMSLSEPFFKGQETIIDSFKRRIAELVAAKGA